MTFQDIQDREKFHSGWYISDCFKRRGRFEKRSNDAFVEFAEIDTELEVAVFFAYCDNRMDAGRRFMHFSELLKYDHFLFRHRVLQLRSFLLVTGVKIRHKKSESIAKLG